MKPKPPLAAILDDVATHLEQMLDEGVRTAELTRKTLAALAPSATTPPGDGGRRPAAAAPPPARAPAPAPMAAAAPADAGVEAGLTRIATEVAACARCELHLGRTRTVPGQGSPSPEILFVGEAPGADEDEQGLAFVGRAGQLLTRMIEAMGYTRDQVFIGNINKCRPPGNRKPLPGEMAACLPYLEAQIALLKPKVIIALGATAVQGLVGIDTGITKLRGTWLTFRGIDLMPTYHPAYMLRNPPAKKDVWEDLKEVLRRLGRPVPPPPPKR